MRWVGWGGNQAFFNGLECVWYCGSCYGCG